VKHSEEYNAFTNTVDRLLSVSKDEILLREQEYRKKADANPNKRGPKPKVKTKRAIKPRP
jgi:hypothetical protein